MTKVFPQTTVTMSLLQWQTRFPRRLSQCPYHFTPEIVTIVWENTFVIATRKLNSRLGKCFCCQIIARQLWQSSGEMLLPVHCNDIGTISLLQIWKHFPRLSQFPKKHFPRLSQFPDDCHNFLARKLFPKMTVTTYLLQIHWHFSMWITMEFFCKSRVADQYVLNYQANVSYPRPTQ